MGGSFNPLSTILKDNKLTETNYVDWKKNLNLVLTAENYTYVLTEVCPSSPNSISTPEEDAAYHKWQKTDKLAKCYILASMSNVLQQQHERMLSAYDILLNLKEMFGEQSRATREVTINPSSTLGWLKEPQSRIMF